MTPLALCQQLKTSIRARKQVWGAWTQTAHESIAQIYARLGYPFLVIDTEHAAIGEVEIARICHTLRGTNTLPIVRIREKSLSPIRIALDLGASGVIAPMTETVEEAETVLRYAKYPPEGIRGVGYGPCNNLGLDLKDYVKSANESLVTVVQIETKAGIENLDSILALPGVDGAFIGPYDLSCSYGVTGELDHPLVKDALQHFLKTCARHQKGAGLHIVQPERERLENSIRDGFTWGALSMDVTAVENVARQMKEFAAAAA